MDPTSTQVSAGNVVDIADSVAAIREPDRWLEWLSRSWDASACPSPLCLAIRGMAERIARNEPLSFEEAESAVALMTPAIGAAWSKVLPRLEIVPASATGGFRVRPAIWFTEEATEAGLDEPESFLALAFFLFLRESDGCSILRLCDDCGRFFIDRSRAQRGRYCSSVCRGRGFRRGTPATSSSRRPARSRNVASPTPVPTSSQCLPTSVTPTPGPTSPSGALRASPPRIPAPTTIPPPHPQSRTPLSPHPSSMPARTPRLPLSPQLTPPPNSPASALWASPASVPIPRAIPTSIPASSALMAGSEPGGSSGHVPDRHEPLSPRLARLLAWVERRGGTASIREVTRGGPGPYRKSADLVESDAIALVRLGLAEWFQPERSSRGRPPGRAFRIVARASETPRNPAMPLPAESDPG